MRMAKARIAVIGAGLMGHGIAQVFALAGHDVSIHDSTAANLDSAKARILANLKDLGDDSSAVERVRPTADLAAAVREADYVVEAVLEDLPLKRPPAGDPIRPVDALLSPPDQLLGTLRLDGLVALLRRARLRPCTDGGAALETRRVGRRAQFARHRASLLTGPGSGR